MRLLVAVLLLVLMLFDVARGAYTSAFLVSLAVLLVARWRTYDR